MSSSVLDRMWEIPTELAALESRIAALRSEQLALIGELDRLVPAGFPDAAREEVAVACRISDAEARRRLDTARAVTAAPSATTAEPVLPATARALAAGEISLAHGEAMAAAVRGLDIESARWVEVQVLADPRARTPGQLAYRARQAALQVGAEQAERRATAQANRELVAWEFDGRVSFSWTMPSVDAAVVAGWLDGVSGRRGPDDQRLSAQRRADALFDVVHGALAAGSVTQSNVEAAAGRLNLPHVEVLATHESLLDQVWREAGTATPAACEGGGWAGGSIDGRSVFGAQLRQLSCDADVRVTLINEYGCILDQGRTTRVVSTRLRGLLTVRDQHCRFVGCQVPARRCHAHHVWHWSDGGPTDLSNLILLCDRHHHAVHDGGWTVDLHADGSVVWTSPTGQAIATPAELDTLALPPPEPGLDDDHLDGHWIRPGYEVYRGPPSHVPEPAQA
ncbi:MAG TPA: DUF222 domain-containing protein [Mycobacteriales bacterium]